jgi:hypothetical protein
VDAVVGKRETLSYADSEVRSNMAVGFPDRGHRRVDSNHVIPGIRKYRRQKPSARSQVEDPRPGIESGILEGSGHIRPTNRVEQSVKPVEKTLRVPPALLIKDCRRSFSRRHLGDLRATIDGNGESRADLTHPVVAEPPEALGEGSDRDTFYRVEIHC